MSQIHSARAIPSGCWPCVFLSFAVAGCATAQARRYDALAAELRGAGPPARQPAPTGEQEQLELDDLRRLDRQALIEAVLARNPSVEAAREGWSAALAEYPQVTALDDPMVEYSLAPRGSAYCPPPAPRSRRRGLGTRPGRAAFKRSSMRSVRFEPSRSDTRRPWPTSDSGAPSSSAPSVISQASRTKGARHDVPRKAQ